MGAAAVWTAMNLARPATLDLKSAKIAAVVNAASGRCSVATGDALRAHLEARGLKPARVWCGPAPELERTLDAVMADRPDILLVLGGDGTVRTVAERCDRTGPLLMPLPGGTMNVLPRALYGARSWRRAIDDVLSAPQLRPVNGAEAAGRRFFAAAIFGGPSLLQEAREAVRYGELGPAVRKGLTALRSALDRELICLWDGGSPAKGEVVAVLCPLASRRLTARDARLEAAVIDLAGPVDALRLVLAAAFRDWRADPDVRCATAKVLEVLSSDRIPALLDGERFSFEGPLRVTVLGEAFYALTPAAPSEADALRL